MILIFRPHEMSHLRPNSFIATKENEFFEISIVLGKGFYSNGIDTFEVALINKETNEFVEVKGHLSEDELEEYIKKKLKL
jgi:hypothetical protein